MNIVVSPKLLRIFLHVLRARYWVAGVYVLLAMAGIYGASRIPTDAAIERLVVAGDPVAQATLEFERVFPEGEQALIMLEAPDPLSQSTLQGAERVERQLGAIPKVEAHSVLTLFRRADSSADLNPENAARVRRCSVEPGFWASTTSESLSTFGSIPRPSVIARLPQSTRSCCPSRTAANPGRSHFPPFGASGTHGSTRGWNGRPERRRKNSCRCSGFSW